MRFASDSKGNKYVLDQQGSKRAVDAPLVEKVSCCPSKKDRPEKPTLGTMAASLAAATQAWAKKGFKLVDEEERKKRFAVCISCEYIYDGGRCSKCGCFMEIKSKLAGMKCPVDKW